MNITWSADAWDEYVEWQRTDMKIVGAINALIRNLRRDPFKGLGKPEPLRYELQGFWSRRISQEHRLVYRVSGTGNDQRVEIAQCRHHY